MAKTLLRSGNIDDFQRTGGGGQAVFDSANQIREALRLRKHLAIAHCLAVPQLNEEGDRVDWYSPVTGAVTSWKEADMAQRERALRYLENIQHTVSSLSVQYRQSPKPAQQLFGALLEKTLQFPDEKHLFLVDDKPVISFWGFVNLNESARDDAFACLRERLLPAPVFIEETPAETTVQDAPTPPPATPAPIAPQPEPAPVSHIVRWRWAFAFAAAIVASLTSVPFWPSASAPAIAQQAPANARLMPQLSNTLPLQKASYPPQPKAVADAALLHIAKDALVMEPNQLRAGTTRFLNGNWRVLLEMKNAPSLRYQIENNKGTARLVHGDNIICRVALFSGLHQNGELVIKSRGTARCSDGSRFPMPEISCKAGANDAAVCVAHYRSDVTIPVTFKKTGA